MIKLILQNIDKPKEILFNISVPNFYGDGSDGVLNSHQNVILPSTLDGDVVYKYYDSLTLNTGHIMTVSHRCQGLFIYVKNDCIINGTLTMTGKGAIKQGEQFNPRFFDHIPTIIGPQNLVCGSIGGSGGNSVTAVSGQTINGQSGFSGLNGTGGGGGSGRSRSISGSQQVKSGSGREGTTWSGGSGGGGAIGLNGTVTGGAGVVYGGRGGNASSNNNNYTAGGGAGNPGGAGINGGLAGQSGTGGMIILIVGGKLIVNGKIESHGSNGGSGHAGGGSSGGGPITLLYKTEFINNGTVSNYGGISISGGGAGGSGSLRIFKCSQSLPEGVEETLFVSLPMFVSHPDVIKFPLVLQTSNFSMTKYNNEFPDYHKSSRINIFDNITDELVYDSQIDIYNLTKHTISSKWTDIQLDHEYRIHIQYTSGLFNKSSTWGTGLIINTPLLPKPEIINVSYGSQPELIPITLTGSNNLDEYNIIKSQFRIFNKETNVEVFNTEILVGNFKEFNIKEEDLPFWIEYIKENTEYEVDIRYYLDMYGHWSEWSDRILFTTPHISNIQPTFVYPNSDQLDIHDFPINFEGSNDLTYYEDCEWSLYNETFNIESLNVKNNNNKFVLENPIIIDYIIQNVDLYFQVKYRSKIYKKFTKLLKYKLIINKNFEDFTTSGNVSFASTPDGPTVYKNFNNLTINSGHTVTTSNRCKGLVIYVHGDCTINGTLSMTARGCRGAGVYFKPFFINQLKNRNDILLNLMISPNGGSGGNGVSIGSHRGRDLIRSGNSGNAGINGACGGGGSGGVKTHNSGGATSGSGSTGTTWSGGGGSGGCGMSCGQWHASQPVSQIDHYGTNGVCVRGHPCVQGATAGGGAGIIAGDGHNCSQNGGYSGQVGTGGLLILIVNGTLTINGKIESIGSSGGVGTACGGSSGGGSITILYKNNYINNGTIDIKGGPYVSGYASGGAGGAGSLRIHQFIRPILSTNIVNNILTIEKPNVLVLIDTIQFPLILQSSNYKSNIDIDSHGKTIWQIVNVDTNEIEYDSGESNDLTIHTLNTPWMTYNQNKNYAWKVKYKSSIYGVYSEWSDLSNAINTLRPINISPNNISINNFPIELISQSDLENHSKSKFIIKNKTLNTTVYESDELTTNLNNHLVFEFTEPVNLTHTYQWAVQHYSESNNWTPYSYFTDFNFANFIINKPINILPQRYSANPETVIDATLFDNSFNTNINIDLIELEIRKNSNKEVIFNNQLLDTNISNLINHNIEYEYRIRYRLQYYNIYSDYSNYNQFINYKLPIEDKDFNSGEIINLIYENNSLYLKENELLGYRILPDINLTPILEVKSIKFEWDNEHVKIEYSISFDNGTNWTNYKSINNNTFIDEITENISSINCILRIKQIFEKQIFDPILNSFKIIINAPYVPKTYIDIDYIE